MAMLSEWQTKRQLSGRQMAKILGVTETQYSLVKDKKLLPRHLKTLLYYEQCEKLNGEIIDLRFENATLKEKIDELNGEIARLNNEKHTN